MIGITIILVSILYFALSKKMTDGARIGTKITLIILLILSVATTQSRIVAALSALMAVGWGTLLGASCATTINKKD